jgi:hypothetical protein
MTTLHSVVSTSYWNSFAPNSTTDGPRNKSGSPTAVGIYNYIKTNFKTICHCACPVRITYTKTRARTHTHTHTQCAAVRRAWTRRNVTCNYMFLFSFAPCNKAEAVSVRISNTVSNVGLITPIGFQELPLWRACDVPNDAARPTGAHIRPPQQARWMEAVK